MNIEENVEEPNTNATAPANSENRVLEAEESCDSSGETAPQGSTGKFKSEAELLKAYQNLEAEFTRKSQKLKELERQIAASEQEGEKAQNLLEAKTEGKNESFDKASIILDDDFLNNFVYNDDEIVSTIIKNYFKQNKVSSAPAVISGASEPAFSVAKKEKPKTLAEARSEAEKLFN